jgi:thiopurine S-methyltransferase
MITPPKKIGGTVDLSIWANKWKSGSTGWHRPRVHESLLHFEKSLLPKPKSRILVPLCGKTVDIEYLASHANVQEVVGVDAIQKAFEEFSKEHPALEIKKHLEEPQAEFDRWSGKHTTLLTGDFFQFDAEKHSGGRFDAIWDRGSLVAIDPNLREHYVDVMGKSISKTGRILLSTFVADTTKGPPYSIDEPEVRRLFGGKPFVDAISVLSEHNALALEPWYRAFVMWMMYGHASEKIFLIQAS